MGIPMGMFESAISSMSLHELLGKREEESMLDAYHDPVLEVLRSRPGEEMRASEVHAALDVEFPERSVVIVLSELRHRGLVERRSEAQPGRRRAVSWYRVVGAPEALD